MTAEFGERPTPLHADCIPCLAKAGNGDAETEAQAMLLMYLRNELEDAYADLCFFHRRSIDDALRSYAAES